MKLYATLRTAYNQAAKTLGLPKIAVRRQKSKKPPPFSLKEIQRLDDRAKKSSRSLLEKRIESVSTCGPAANIALGVGQSFMGGSASSQRLNLTTDRLLKGIAYRAMMLVFPNAAKRPTAFTTSLGQWNFARYKKP